MYSLLLQSNVDMTYQLQALHSSVAALHQYVEVVSAPSGSSFSERHNIADLVDDATLVRIRSLQRMSGNTVTQNDDQVILTPPILETVETQTSATRPSDIRIR
eukprot:8358479-Karenia_brevis.AAC.1